MKRVRFFLSAIVVVSVMSVDSTAQITIGSTEVDTSTIVSNLDTPWEILWGPDDHIWITERYGRISRLDPETGELSELVTINDVHEQSESGLLGMVLHPDFANTPSVFLVYNYLESSIIKERLVKYTYSEGIMHSPVTLLEGIDGAGNHNGSRLVIDAALKLYMTTGDAGNTSNSQNLNSLNGKVLRMNLDGTVPEDNPIPGSYLWSWGHRNAQGLVISPSGIMYSSEHGPSSDDEVNIIEMGRNYGWPNVKGFCDGATETTFCADSNVFEPIAAWTPTLAVAGTDFYAHPAIPEWQNSILVTSLKASRMVALKLSEDGQTVLQEEAFFTNWYGRLRDICVSPDGRVFLAVSNRDGRGTVNPGDDRIVEIAAKNTAEYCHISLEETICPGETYHFNGQEISQSGTYTDTVPYQDACDTIISLTLDFHEIPVTGLLDSVVMAENETTTLTASEGFNSYSWNDDPPSQANTYILTGSELGKGTHLVTLRVEDANGCTQADTVHITVTAAVGITTAAIPVFSIYPNPLSGTELTIDYSTTSEAMLVIYNQVGTEVSRSILPSAQSSTTIVFPHASGMYYLSISSKNGILNLKVLKH